MCCFFTLPKSQYLQLLFFLSTFGLWCLSSRTELAQLGIIVNGKSWKTDTVIWNHQAVMKHEKLAKIHRNSPHLEEAVHVSTPKSWTFITSAAPKSLTNWVKVYQSSATFTCRPDVHSKILSPVQVRTRKKCEVTKITFLVSTSRTSLCHTNPNPVTVSWESLKWSSSVFFVFLVQNPGPTVGIFTYPWGFAKCKPWISMFQKGLPSTVVPRCPSLPQCPEKHVLVVTTKKISSRF